MDYQTDRLHLLPVTIELAQMLMKNSLIFYHNYHLQWNRNWPHDGLKALLPLHAELLEKDDRHHGFGPWIILDRNEKHVLGDIGFKGRPNKEGIVEIGYHIVASERNVGYATEAVRALGEWVFVQPDVKGIEAQCDKGNLASQKVLINTGFEHARRSRDVLVFRKINNHHNHQIARR